MEGADQESGWC